jgi:Fe-S oxidoreductase/nitrate reductase gamma subunit
MPPLSEATRPLMWNVSHTWLMYVLFFAAAALFAWGMIQRIQFWREGREDNERFSDWGKRFWVLVRESLLQKRVRSSPFPGIFHSLLFYSFLVLFITTLIIMVQYDADHFLGLRFNIFQGFTYTFFSLASELAGVLILIGLGMAAYRRYILKPETLPHSAADGLILLFLAVIILTGYFIEGARIAATGDPWKMLSPVGWGTAALFVNAGEGAARTSHAWLWWGHTVLALAWIALIPYTKFVHLISLPTNMFFSKIKPRGELRRVDIEKIIENSDSEAEIKIGIQRADDLTWKQRLDVEACILCGRCEEVCPAYLANKEGYTPRQFISRLKQSLNEMQESAGKTIFENTSALGSEAAGLSDFVNGAFDEEYIWNCRTCTACMEVCPAFVEHVDTLLEIRRNEVLIQGRMPAEAAQAMKMLEANGNPFGPQSDRIDWINQMDVRVVGPGEKVDVLYWIGCCATFDPQKQKIAENLCRLMERCGIDFGVLGADERCCGDPARVIGQEMLFQQIAKEQVESLKQRDFKVLLTSCPHCYNVLAHEYKQFGGDFDVVHHSEFLHEMLWDGTLVPQFGAKRKYVYHDPCYLGRYQKIYDSPREVIKAIPDADVVEMKDYREKSLCCGGGGGHYWMDLKRGERINNLRVKQAFEAGADTIVTSCAYCLHMLEDSVKLLNHDDTMRVIDIGSLMFESLEEPEARKTFRGSPALK